MIAFSAGILEANVMDDESQTGGTRLISPEQSAGGNRLSMNPGIGRISLVCGLVAWLGEFLILLADLGWIPRTVILTWPSLLITATCWMVAVFGGLLAAVFWRSRAGCIAFIIGILIPLQFIGLVLLVGSHWLD